MRFIHLADIHAGHRQYNIKQREADMQASFRYALDQAIERDAGAILLPGDLFHSRDLRPEILAETERSLERIPEEIPVLVTAGNHDRNLTPRALTWLEYLDERGLITLLEADLDGDIATFRSADEEATLGDRTAGFVDYTEPELNGPIRVFGLQYRGGYIDTAIERVAAGLEEVNTTHGRPAYTILLAHFGVEEVVPGLGANVQFPDLEPLRDRVDYLALGHIHKQYEAEGWIYNPGSLEAHDTREARWEDEHGFYQLDVTGDGGTATHVTGKRRPFYRIEFDVTEHATMAGLEEAFREHVRAEREPLEAHCHQDTYLAGGDRRAPVIDLRLHGTLQFSRGQLDVDRLSALATEELDALHVQASVAITSADVQALLDELGEDAAFSDDGTLDTAALEGEVFETIARESPYGDRAEAVATLLSETRELATERNEPAEGIAELVQDRRRTLFPDAGDADADTATDVDSDDGEREDVAAVEGGGDE